MDDLTDESLDVFHERFEDYKKKVKELLLDSNASLLVPSISILAIDEVATTVEDIIEEATEVQVIGTSADNPPPTIFEAAIVAQAPELPMDAQLKAPTKHSIEV